MNVLLGFCLVALAMVNLPRSQQRYSSSFPYLVQNDHTATLNWKREQEVDRIMKLPGQPSVKFNQYSGYVTVNEVAGRALFYWLTEAEENAASKPLLLWLSGGPGCSTLAYGAMEEIGPFHIHKNGKGLYNNIYSWNKFANLIFLESPAGVGFSYANTSSDLKKSGDNRTAEDAYVFLVRWFERFPQYKHREFYIAGDSYAGHYVPQLSKIVYERNVKGVVNPSINFTGFMVGNAVTDFYHDNVGRIAYWWDHALISDTMYSALMKACDFSSENISDLCKQLQNDALHVEFGDLDPHSIYTPICPRSSSEARRTALRRLSRNPLVPKRIIYDPCMENYAEIYFNRPVVQKSLHANYTGIPYKWTACSAIVFDNWQDSAFSVLPIYKELMAAGLRIWVYSGDVDAVIPVTATRLSIDHLKLKTKVQWFPWYLNGQVGGHCEVYDGLTLVIVRNAGHDVPNFQPARALSLIKAYLLGIRFLETK